MEERRKDALVVTYDFEVKNNIIIDSKMVE